MGEAKRQLVTKWVQLRIRVLAMQSYALLFLMAGLIAYGFFISGRALETTNADLQDVRQSTERLRLTAEQERDKYRLLDLGFRFSRRFNDAHSELEKTTKDILQKLSSGSGFASYPQNYFFRTDFEDSLKQIEEYSKSGSGYVVVNFAVPKECLNLAKLELKRPREQYFLWIGDYAYDYSSYVSKLAVVFVQPYRTNPSPEPPKDLNAVLSSGIEAALPTLCNSINTSKEYQQILKTVSQIDDVLDQQDAIDAKSGAPGSGTTASSPAKLQDAGAVALLLANRFGPLVIIFFFSSLIITLYKYNSRLVSFYYARLYALEASDVPIYDAEFASAVKVFSPDGVDYGRAPRTPVDIAGDIATKIVEKIDILKEEKPKAEKPA